MKLKRLRLVNFRGHPNTQLDFGEFSCMIGQNGVGKTTVLNAIALLCSSLDFKQIEFEAGEDGFAMKVTPEQRLKAILASHIRNLGQPGGAKDFLAEGTFAHGGKDYVVSMTKDGFARNDLLKSDFWWPGIYYFAKFDSDQVNFQLPFEHWDRFAKTYSGITGHEVEPEVFEESDMAEAGLDPRVVVGFWLHKKMGKVHSKAASAGERKTAKALTQIANIPVEKAPHVVLVDNMEMHVHPSRHLRMFKEMREFLPGVQIIATTHSAEIINKYEPKSEIFDLDKIIEESML